MSYRRNSLNRRDFLKVAGAAGLTTLAACAPSGSGQPAPSQPSPSRPSAKQELFVATATEVDTLDAQMTTASQSLGIGYQMLEGLLWRDPKTFKITPRLATEWKNVAPTAWEFKLRPNVTFHNGDPFTAEDVKASYARILNPDTKSLWLGQAKGISGVEVIDPLTVRVLTEKPFPALEIIAAQLGIASKRSLAEKDTAALGRSPVGTGPFKIQEWVKDDRTVLVANETYWGGKPKLDKITFKPIPEVASRMAALKSGQAHIVVGVPAEQVADLNRGPDWLVKETVSTRTLNIQVVSNKPGPMADKRVRQALNYAIDKDALINQLYAGKGVKSSQLLNPLYFGFNPDLKTYPYDPNKAKQLLAEAGFPNGLEVRHTPWVGTVVDSKVLAEAIGGQLAKVGIKQTVEYQEYGVFLAGLRSGEVGPLFPLHASWPPDADFMFRPYFPGGVWPFYAYSKEWEDAVTAAGSTLDRNERLRLYKKVTEIMFEDAASVFLHDLVTLWGVSKKVEGWEPDPQDFFEFRTASLSA